MNKKFIKLHDPSQNIFSVEKKIFNSIKDVIKSGNYILNKQVELFEKEFSDYNKVPYTVGTANGTDAIKICLLACGVKNGDEVITVANAGGYTTVACLQIGAVPVYVDINDHLLIDFDLIKLAITEKTKAIVVTHLYGQCVNVLALRQLIPNRIKIIEDCAQAHGAEINSRKAGSMGDCGAFSFYPTKNLGSLGDGGAVITSDKQIYQKALSLRTYGWSDSFVVATENGINSRLDEIHAAVLRILLKNLDKNNIKRKNIAKKYRKKVPNANWVGTIENNVFNLCVILENDRDLLIDHLNRHNVQTAIHYPIPDYRQPAWYNDKISLINTEKAIREIVSIPLYPGMTKKNFNFICSVLEKFYGSKNS
jgi:dTDP-4-amino-4,6-dideoxygalactose transaminase